MIPCYHVTRHLSLAAGRSTAGMPKLRFVFHAPQSVLIHVTNKIRLVYFETKFYMRKCDANVSVQIFTHTKKNTEKITSLRETIEYTETRLKGV
jgi:ATP sulfurylase